MVITLFWWSLGIIGLILLIKHIKSEIAIMNVINVMPGPKGHPILGILLNILCSQEELWTMFREYSLQYYPIYKHWILNIPIVNFIAPEDIEILMSSKKHSSKSRIYIPLHPWVGKGLLTSAGEKWQNRRKMLTPAFHFNILQQFSQIFYEESKLLTKKLEKECEEPFTDVEPILGLYTLRTICETAMGTRLEEGSEEALSYAQSIHRMGDLILNRALKPWLYNNFVYYLLSSEYKEFKSLLRKLHSFTRSVIAKRQISFKDSNSLAVGKSRKNRMAMLDLLIHAKNSGQDINDEGIREEVDTFMFEGHDTTSQSLAFTFLLLACHPDVQVRVCEEMQEELSDIDGMPSIQQLQNLRYLEQVIKESLRMYPSVHFISRVTDEEIVSHSGYTIPPKTLIQVHIFDMHHNPKLYPDPYKFDPERFSMQNCQERHPFAYIPFSAGPRNCIGKNFAMIEMKIVVTEVLKKFIIEPVDKLSDIVLLPHLVLKTQNGIKIKFKKRF